MYTSEIKTYKEYFLQKRRDLEDQIRELSRNDTGALLEVLDNEQTVQYISSSFVTSLMNDGFTHPWANILLKAYRLKRNAYVIKLRNEEKANAVRQVMIDASREGVEDITFDEAFERYNNLFLNPTTGDLYNWRPIYGKRLTNKAWFITQLHRFYNYIYGQCLNPEGLPEINLIRKSHKPHTPRKPYVHIRVAEREPMILNLRSEGKSITTIAKMAGVTRDTVYRVLKAKGALDTNHSSDETITDD